MTLIFFLMSVIVVASALGVVAYRNPIHSALCLVVNLLTVAGLFASLEAHFLASVQIIVYAGAIMVLVLFVLMLLNLKVEQSAGSGYVPLVGSVIVGIAFVGILVPILGDVFSFPDSPVGAQRAIEGSVAAVGRRLYKEFLFPFEAASILIMAAIVGAVMLAKRQGETGGGK